MGRVCNTHGGDQKSVKEIRMEFRFKNGRRRLRWEDNNKMNLVEAVGCCKLDMHVVQQIYRLRTFTYSYNSNEHSDSMKFREILEWLRHRLVSQ
jgi:hypothetical protein